MRSCAHILSWITAIGLAIASWNGVLRVVQPSAGTFPEKAVIEVEPNKLSPAFTAKFRAIHDLELERQRPVRQAVFAEAWEVDAKCEGRATLHEVPAIVPNLLREPIDNDAHSTPRSSRANQPSGLRKRKTEAADAIDSAAARDGSVVNIYNIEKVERLVIQGAPAPAADEGRSGTGRIEHRRDSVVDRSAIKRSDRGAISDDPPRFAAVEFVQPAEDEPPRADEPLSPIIPMLSDSPAAVANAPITVESSLLSELGRAQQRADASSAPNATGVAATIDSPAVDTTQLTRDSSTAGTVSGTRRAQVSIQPVIRGFHQQQIYGQYQGANFTPVRFDLDSMLGSIDPGIIDNLIVIPGPYGVKYGPGLAFIDIVPTPTPRYDVPEWHSRTQTNFQSNGQQWYGRETIYGGGEFYGMRATYGHKIGNDYVSGDGTTIPASYNVRDADISLSVDLTPDSTLDFEYLRQDLTNTEYAGLMFDARFRKTDAYFARYKHTDWLAGELLVEAWHNRTVIAGDNLKLSKQLFYRNNFFFTSGGQTQFPQIGFVGAFDAAAANSGFRFSPTWETMEGVRLTTGVDLHYVQQVLNEFDNFTNRNLQFAATGFENFPIARSNMIDPGLFAELQVPVRPDLKVTAGARVDWVRTDADPFHSAKGPDGLVAPIFAPGTIPVTRLDTDLFRTGLTQNDVLFNAFVAADQQLDENLELRLGFGHGQRPPSLTERYAYLPFLTVLQSSENSPLGDPKLKPEQASQFDIALNGRFDEVRFRAATFATYVDNFISYRYRPPPTDPAASYLTFTNVSAMLTGFELSGDFDLNEWWTPFADLSYLYGENLSADEPLAGIYPLKSRLGLRFHEPFENRYGIELSVRMVGDQPRVANSLFEPTTPGFTVFYVRGYWKVSDHLRFSSGIENLAGRNYIDHLSVHAPAVLEPGFNFYLSMQLDY